MSFFVGCECLEGLKRLIEGYVIDQFPLHRDKHIYNQFTALLMVEFPLHLYGTLNPSIIFCLTKSHICAQQKQRLNFKRKQESIKIKKNLFLSCKEFIHSRKISFVRWTTIRVIYGRACCSVDVIKSEIMVVNSIKHFSLSPTSYSFIFLCLRFSCLNN